MLDNLLAHYTLIDKIGEGSFSEVTRVKEKKSGKFFAAKRLKKFFSTLDEATSCGELRTLLVLEHHPNVLSLVEFAFESASGKLTLIFDLMDMSMYDYIKNRKKTLSENKCKSFLYQLVLGLNHLHRSGIFHRDIKPENILIRTSTSSNNYWRSELVQLADLGSVCPSDVPHPRSAYISTRWYRAPECLLTSGYYGPKMDVWALGCCFYEILTLAPLFPGDSELNQLHKIHVILGTPSQKVLELFKHRSLDIEFPKKSSVGFHQLIPMLSVYGVDVLTKTLAYHPKLRISAKRLLEHRYFEELRSKGRNSSARMLMSSSLGSTPESSVMKNSLKNSRESQISIASSRSETIRKLQEAQGKLNKQLERGWGMNSCPVKIGILQNLKSSVKNK